MGCTQSGIEVPTLLPAAAPTTIYVEETCVTTPIEEVKVAAGSPSRAIDQAKPKCNVKPKPQIRTQEDVTKLLPTLKQTALAQKLTKQEYQVLLRGQKYFDEGKYDKALEQYESLSDKEQWFIFNRMSECCLGRQEYGACLEFAEKSLQAKFNIAAVYLKARALDVQVRNQEAIQCYAHCLEYCPHQEDLLYFKGLCHYYESQFQESVADLEECVKIKQSVRNIFALAKSYNFNQQTDLAIQYFEQIMRRQPNNVKLMKEIAENMKENQLFDQAQAVLQKCSQLETSGVQMYLDRGKELFDNKNYKEAEDWYLKATKVGKIEQAYLQLGSCYYQQCYYTDAIKIYNQALEINPQSAEAYYRLGLVYYWKQDYKTAVQNYSRSLELRPDMEQVLLDAGDAYYYYKDYKKCLASYMRAYELNPKGFRPNESIAQTYYFYNHCEEALPFFQRALDAQPYNLRAKIYYAKSLFYISNYGQSYKEFMRAKELLDEGYGTFKEHEASLVRDSIQDFINKSAQWQQKKRIGYVSEADKQQIIDMKKNFEKNFQNVFGQLKSTTVSTTVTNPMTKSIRPKKPIGPQFFQMVKLMAEDGFKLDISQGQNSALVKLAQKVRQNFNSDSSSFQILAYMFIQYYWENRFEVEYADSTKIIEQRMDHIIEYLSKIYPPTQPRSNISLPTIPEYPKTTFDIFEAHFFRTYQLLVKQIERVNERAKRDDLQPFRKLVAQVEKKFGGSHAKAGLKFPQKTGTGPQAEKMFQQRTFKVMMRIFEKMFKELGEDWQRKFIFMGMEQLVGYQTTRAIHNILPKYVDIWIRNVNDILFRRNYNKIPVQCFISDLVRGKCMFTSHAAVQKAVIGTIALAQSKGYKIMEVDNRLSKGTQDVVLKIKVNSVVSELQLALEFDTTGFDFGHNFYEIQRCPLGIFFGSCLFLTKQVEQSFLEKLYRASKSNCKPQQRKALNFVLAALRKSTLQS